MLLLPCGWRQTCSLFALVILPPTSSEATLRPDAAKLAQTDAQYARLLKLLQPSVQ
jgi:hypothetical protein